MADEITRLIYQTIGGREAVRTLDQIGASAAVAGDRVSRLQRDLALTSAGRFGGAAVGASRYGRELDTIGRAQDRITRGGFDRSLDSTTRSMRNATRGGDRLTQSLFAMSAISQTARGNLTGLAFSAERLGGFGALGGPVGGAAFGATLGVGVLSLIGGTQTEQLERRVRLFTDSQAEAVETTRDLFDITRRTRTSLTAITETYQAAARGTERYSLAQETVLSLTESVAQASRISGGSAASQQAAVVQFSQALSSGELRGQELRSILEQNFRLSKAVADGLSQLRGEDIGTGELLRLGASGDLRTGELLAALRSQQPILDAENATLGVLPGEAARSLGTSLIELGGELDRQLGVTTVVTDALEALSGAAQAASDSIVDREQTGFVAFLKNNFREGSRQFIDNAGGLIPALAEGMAMGNRSNAQVQRRAFELTPEFQTAADQIERTLRNLEDFDYEIFTPIERFFENPPSSEQSVRQLNNLQTSLGLAESAAGAYLKEINLAAEASEFTGSEIDARLNVPLSTTRQLLGDDFRIDFDISDLDAATSTIGRVVQEIQSLRRETQASLDVEGIAEGFDRAVNPLLRSITAANQATSEFEAARRGDISFGDAQDNIGQFRRRQQLSGQIDAQSDRLRSEGVSDGGIDRFERQARPFIEDLIAAEERLSEVRRAAAEEERFDERLASLRTEAGLKTELLGLSERDREIQSVIIPLRREAERLGIEGADTRIDALERELQTVQRITEAERFRNELGQATGAFFGHLIRSAGDAEEAVLRLIGRIVELIAVQSITNSLNTQGGFLNSIFGTPAASGGNFAAGRRVPMASGGVLVERPITIPMAGGGAVQVGEAGPEAMGVFPVRPGRDGRFVPSGADARQSGPSSVVLMDSNEIDRAIAQGKFDRAIGARVSSVGNPVNRAARGTGGRRR
ncbi:MAG: tape measure protein [Planctomycetota bacterium]